MLTDTAKEIENKSIVEHLSDEVWNKRNPLVVDEVYSTDIQCHGVSTEINGLNELII